MEPKVSSFSRVCFSTTVSDTRAIGLQIVIRSSSPPRASDLTVNRKMPEFPNQAYQPFDNVVEWVCFLHLVRGEARFAKCITPPCPISAVPIALLYPRLSAKRMKAERDVAVPCAVRR